MQAQEKPRRSDLQRYLKLAPYDEIRDRIVTSLSSLRMKVEEIDVEAGQGRILAQDAIAQVSVPSTMSSAMDGYAIRSTETIRASPEDPIHFRILGSIFGNANGEKLKITGKETFYVSTGAPLPADADAVVRIEDTRIKENGIIIPKPVAKGENIVPAGQDVQYGQVLVRKGHALNGLDVALLLSTHLIRVSVTKIPRVGIISIGDELRGFKDIAWQTGISQSIVVNNFFNMMSSFLSELGIPSNLVSICKNNVDEIRKSVESNISDYDVVLIIGGSSVGARDYAPTAIESVHNSKIIFHGVKMVPIKPAGLAFVKDKPVVIVPAHASSAAFAFFMIVLPVLNIISGLQFDDRKVRLNAICDEQIENPRGLDALALVQLRRMGDGSYHASHSGWYSNLISNLTKANGFVVMKAKQVIRESELVNVELLGLSQLGRIR